MPAPLSPSDLLAHYRVISPLGAGGMGEVFLAVDTLLNRNVAIKVLPAESSAGEDAQRRMLREAQLIATIDHPNVCTIYEIGERDGLQYIVMQYVQGETLGDRLRRAPFTLAEAIDFGRQTTAALVEAHRHGIVHRDLKPGNIMLSSSGIVKVLDFGLARSFARSPDAPTEALISQADVVSGTLQYMSPEQLLGEPLDGRSDLFSLGVVLYEIAAGRRPFDRRTAAATINAILVEEPESLAAVDLAPLGPLIGRALAKKAGQRFQGAAEMHEAFTALHEGRSSPVSRVSSSPSFRSVQIDLPPDPAATKLCMRGRLQWSKRNPDSLRQAIALFQEAAELDPMHAGAFAGLADAYMMLGFLQVIPPREVIPKVKASALHAVELDPELAEPHATLGFLAGLFEWNWPEAQRELLEAIRLNPHYQWAPHWYGLLAAPKSLDDSLKYLSLAHEIDPVSPIIHTAVGIAHHHRRDYRAALRIYGQVLDTEGAFSPAHYYIGLTYEQLGDYDSAIRNFSRSVELSGGGGFFLAPLGHCYGLSGQQELAIDILRKLEERSRERYLAPYNIMLIHLGLGDSDATFEWLERALEDRNGLLWQAPVEPRFDAIREDARYIELMMRYGLREPQNGRI